VSRPFVAVGNRLPNGWGDAARQFALVFLAYQGYQIVRGLTDAQAALAFANAERIIDIEQALGTFFEPALQATLIGNVWVIDLANFLYMNSHFVVTTSFLVWLYLFRNSHFYFVRNMFMVAMILALVGYGLYPTAPPRLIPEAGFVDTIAQFTAVQQDSQAVSFLVNQYAAVPSMHIGFAAMVGATGVALARHDLGRVLWALYPVLVFAVIVVTANHFWVDAAAGALVALLSYLVADRVLARARPGVWSFRPAPNEAAA
jgi:hypothetical protein